MTAANVPKVPHVPLVSVADARSTTPLVESTPAPVSVPVVIVRGTDVANHGPPERATAPPVGAVVSGVTVKVAVFGVASASCGVDRTSCRWRSSSTSSCSCLYRLPRRGRCPVPNTAGKSTLSGSVTAPDGAAAVTVKLPLLVPVGA